MGDSKLLERRQCPKCAAMGGDKNRDNLAVYDDNHAKCFACGYMEQPGMKGKKGMTKKQESTTTHFENPIVESVSLASRNIRDDITDRYGVGADAHGRFHFPYFNLHTGKPVATKSRASMKERDFRWKGNVNEALLFGSQLYEKRHNACLLLEGETDTLSAAEMLEGAAIGGNRILPLGISKGAGSAKGIIKSSLEWLLNRFDTFYVAFDSDDAGLAAAEEAFSVLPLGRAYRVQLPSDVKDVGELLTEHDNGVKLFTGAIRAAQQVVPSIFADESLVDETLSRYYDREKRWGASTGYKSLDKLSGGFAPGTITLVMGGTGTGKSNFSLQLAYNAASPEKPPLIISLEMPNHETMMRFATFELRDPSINYPDAPLRDKAEMQGVLSSIHKNLRFFKSFGSLELDDLLRAIEVSVDAYGTELVVLDHIGFAVPSGEWSQYGLYMKGLKALAVRKGIAIIVVSHVSTKESAKEGGATQLSLTDIRASKDIIQDSDTVWGIERARDSSVMLLRTLKVHRSAGGRYGEVEFDFVDGRYVELDDTDCSGTAYSKQLRGDDYEKQPGSDISKEVPTDGLRVGEGGLLQDLYAGLHKSDQPSEENGGQAVLRNRSEGKILAGRRRQASSSDKAESKPEVSASVSKPGVNSERKKKSNLSKLGTKARDNSSGNKGTRQDSKSGSSLKRTLGGGRTQKSGIDTLKAKAESRGYTAEQFAKMEQAASNLL